jgi:hypothetical protein
MMSNDKPPYEFHNGPVDDPISHVLFCIYQGRRTGKTQKLIECIPDERIVIVVHSQSAGRILEGEIREQRPTYNIKNIKFVTYDRVSSYIESLRGLHVPIFFDNAVQDSIVADYVINVNSMFGKRH